MQALFYGIAIAGSFSIGYSLLRIILPKKQEANILEKISYSYALGLIVFLPGMILSLLIFEKFFFITASIFYAILFIIFFIIRKKFNLVDDVKLLEEKKIIYIPKKVLTKEEKMKNKEIDYEKPNLDIISEKETKKQLFKEKKLNVIENLREKTLEIKEKKSDDNRKETLERLKGFAEQVNKKKKLEKKETINKNKQDDIDEEEIEKIGKVNFDDN
ncbi:MAG: hypothetical protein PHP82_00205 [Candidatus ainarchaeum sp.]|nr:hypothetical protein [Candidatus ainarchaeum sp.]